MIICEVNKNHLNVRTRELLTAGSRNVNSVEFRFNSEWSGLTKTATFKTSKKTISLKLSSDVCAIPWEVLADEGEFLAVGVLGLLGETVVLPTVWGVLGKVVDAARLGEDEQEPTPDVYQQILNELAAIDKPAWQDVTGKPFESLGDGLSVEDGVLSAKGGVELSQAATVGEVLTVEEVDEDGKPTKWKTAPAAAEQVQADWGENDETAASFVKNRPGGYTVKQKKKTTVTVLAGEQNRDDFAAFPPFEVGDTVNITVNGTEYSLVARRPDDAPDRLNIALIGDAPNAETKEYGWGFCRNYTDSDNTITSFINATDDDMTVEFYAVDAVEEDVPVKFDPKYIPDVEIDPKNIPDMYYMEKITDITGYSIKLPVTAEETTHDEIPFELGQTWKTTNYNYGEMEVKQALDGTLYIGDYPAMSSIPYYITRTTIKGLSQWISMMQPSGIEIVCTACGEVAKTIPDKYLPSNLFTQDNAPVKFGLGSQSAIQGANSTASGAYSHAEGNGTEALAVGAHSEGYQTTANARGAHAEGNNTNASGMYSHAEGNGTKALAVGAHSEGYRATATARGAHAEGNNTNASGMYSHAEGEHTIASGNYSHAEGAYTTANRLRMTASGRYNIYDDAAFIEKNVSTTISISSSDTYYYSSSYTFNKDTGKFSLVKPTRLTFSANMSNQYVAKESVNSVDVYYLGSLVSSTNTTEKYNCKRFYGEAAAETEGDYIHVVGKGNSSMHSNAYTLDWKGNGWFAGNVYVGSTSGTNKDDGSQKLITASEVYDSLIIPSSTPGSTKKFKICVDDNGTISATEVTE